MCQLVYVLMGLLFEMNAYNVNVQTKWVLNRHVVYVVWCYFHFNRDVLFTSDFSHVVCYCTSKTESFEFIELLCVFPTDILSK